MIGVIVGIESDVPPEDAKRLKEEFEERFPGVVFAVVTRCSALVSISFDPPASDPPASDPLPDYQHEKAMGRA